tara:strand:- start:178 stop:882 length:705 start_codon:yes stop_codon:yes gene_type:complete
MDLNKKIEEQNDLINSINLEIMDQTGEKELINEVIGPLVKIYGPQIIKGLLDMGGDDIIDRKIANLAKKPQRYLDKLEDKVTQKIKNITEPKEKTEYGKYDDREAEEIIRKYKESLKKSDSTSSPYTELSNKYRNITVRFDKPLNLEMQIDTGKKVKARFSGLDEFDIVTVKQTSRGDILSLWNRGMDRNTNLLLYIKNFKLDSAQDVIAQLTYEIGNYNSPKENTVITITSLK